MGQNCCSTQKSEENDDELSVDSGLCPLCQEKGKPVSRLTLQAMLAVSLERIEELSEFRFCRLESCDVVYFDGSGETFTEDDLREKVYQKHPDAECSLVCYCYGHTIGSILSELREHGQTDVVERVTKGTKKGSCACEIRNPQGSCCLGNVRAAVKKLKEVVLLTEPSAVGLVGS